MQRPVLVVIGAGGIGEGIARRLGSGKTVLLADFDEEVLSKAVDGMTAGGFDVQHQIVDVSSQESVKQLTTFAKKLGPVSQVALTAGLSPITASRQQILAVNLLGTAIVIEEFEKIIEDGGACVVIASLAGYTISESITAEEIQVLARTPSHALLSLPLIDKAVPDQWAAYGVSKRANHAQVQHACLSWGTRSARINSISPGAIMTPMLQKETKGGKGDVITDLARNTPAKRLGTSGDVADAAAFLLGPESSFITGSDVLVDGGALAYVKRSS